MRTYWTSEENEAYKEGRIDESRHRTNYNHDRYSSDPDDEAYFQGRKDVEREECVRQEEEEMQCQWQEAEARKQEQEENNRREYEQYLEAMAEHQYDEMLIEQEIMNELSEVPSTEEELFMQIQEDERKENINQNNNGEN